MNRPIRLSISLALALLAAGCATQPLPDGSKVQRLPELDRPAAPLSPEDARKLAELNARILDEQNRALARDDARAAAREAYDHAYWSVYYGVGWPYYGYAPYWGPRHRWNWSFGVQGPLR